MIRIAIYDDNRSRQEALKLLLELETDMIFAGGRANCSSIEEDVEVMQPDVILMDIDMPEVNGIEGLKRLRKANKKVLVIMQTVFEDEMKIFDAIHYGANGYFLKKTPPEKLIDGIRDVLEGGAPMTPLVAARIIKAFRVNDQNEVPETYALTRRELEILSLLSKGMSYKMISNEIHVSYHTVNSHIKKIYEKLQVNSATEAIAKAFKVK